MRTWLKGALVLCAALAMVSVAQAQRQGRGGFGPGGMLQNEAVQKELNLTDDQKTKLKEAMEKVREDNKDIIAKGRDMTREDREKLAKASNEAIGKVLDEKQTKRFKQIQLQSQLRFQPAAAFQNPEVQSKLKLTDEQKEKIKKAGEEYGEKARELFQGGFNEETRKKMADLRKETMDKITGVLTADQKKTWDDLLGKPFEFPRPRRQQ
jgi:Spy/CpxP family protein refolding chaperone